jgi:hypothetical protein
MEVRISIVSFNNYGFLLLFQEPNLIYLLSEIINKVIIPYHGKNHVSPES